MPTVEEKTETLNSLLRGEISAAETYTMAIEKCSESDKTHFTDVQRLRDIQEEHGRACQTLRARIRVSTQRALAFLAQSQRPTGSWIPLWFGNQFAEGDQNPVYGTARELIAEPEWNPASVLTSGLEHIPQSAANGFLD